LGAQKILHFSLSHVFAGKEPGGGRNFDDQAAYSYSGYQRGRFLADRRHFPGIGDSRIHLRSPGAKTSAPGRMSPPPRAARFARCLHLGEQYRDHSRSGWNGWPQAPHSASSATERGRSSRGRSDPLFSGCPPEAAASKTASSPASSRPGYSRYPASCTDVPALSSMVRLAIQCRLRYAIKPRRPSCETVTG
jgi:hypothetical protein